MFSLLPKRIRRGSGGLRIRPFDDKNLSVLLSWTRTDRELRLWAGETFRKMPDEKTFREHLSRDRVTALQAEDRWGRFIGYGELVNRTGGVGTICRVIIDPARRGMGSGKGLVDLLSREGFEKLEFKHLLLNVFAFNTPALRCYRSLGFKPLPNRPKPRAYGGELWELVVMKKVASTKAA
jgi:ribosomal protein S18 acetylase RimI-like enzyme